MDIDHLVRKADYKINHWSQKLFYPRSDRYSEAVECYVKAGDIQYTHKNYSQAIVLFEKAISTMRDCSSTQHDYYESSEIFGKILKGYKKLDNVEKQIETLLELIENCKSSGRFQHLAQLYVKVAELTAQVPERHELSINFYALAADAVDNERTAILYLISAAKLCVTNQKLADAIFHYKRIFSLMDKCTGSLLMVQQGQTFIEYLCCVLALGDLVMANRLMVSDSWRLASYDTTFAATLLQSMNNQNLDLFQETVCSFDEQKKLTPQLTALLLACKKQLTPAAAAAENPLL